MENVFHVDVLLISLWHTNSKSNTRARATIQIFQNETLYFIAFAASEWKK